MVWRLTIALQVIPGHPTELGHCPRGTRLQGAGNGGLLGTARPPKGPLHGWVDANGDVALGDGLGATKDPQQPIEQFVHRTIADSFLRNLHLFPRGGKEAVPFEILAQGTEAGTARGHRAIFCNQRTPLAQRGQASARAFLPKGLVCLQWLALARSKGAEQARTSIMLADFLKRPPNRNLVSIQEAAHVTAWASPSPCLQPWRIQPLLTW